MADLLETVDQEIEDVRTPMQKRAAQAQRLLRGKPRARRQSKIPAKPNARVKELIEQKLATGGTRREIAAFIQQRLGTDTSPESSDSPKRKAELRKIEQEEIDACTKLLVAYVEETYGKLVKDGIGRELSYGAQIEIERGHLKRAY